MSITSIGQEELIGVLDGIVGCETTSKLVKEPKPVSDPRVLATYNDVNGQLKFVVATELQLANSLGAAMTMIPPAGADEASNLGSVPDNIADNLFELLNICSSVFEQCEKQRILIDRLIIPGDDLKEGLSEELTSSNCLLQIWYKLGRYQPGLMSLHRVN